MLLLRLAIGLLTIGMTLLGTTIGRAQDYPSKPVRIVTGGLGGGADFAARLIAQGLSGNLGQQVIVDNRPSGVIPAQTVASAPADGYTLLVYGTALWISQFLQKVPYDPVRDFSPITLVAGSPLVLVVHPSLPVKSVRALIALAKAHPGELNYSSGSTGGSSHLSVELFKAMAGVNIVRIFYKSGGQETTDLLGGQVQLAFSTPASVMPHVKSGRLRALAVTSLHPSALAPGIPTIAETGVPDYESVSMHGLFAPAKTPEVIVKRLNQEAVRFLNTPIAKEKFFGVGIETIGSSPEEFAAKIKSEMARMGKVIREAGIKAD